MDQKTREEFEKLSKANQEWVMEVCRLLGMLNEDQQKAAVGLARTLANCNAAEVAHRG